MDSRCQFSRCLEAVPGNYPASQTNSNVNKCLPFGSTNTCLTRLFRSQQHPHVGQALVLNLFRGVANSWGGASGRAYENSTSVAIHTKRESSKTHLGRGGRNGCDRIRMFLRLGISLLGFDKRGGWMVNTRPRHLEMIDFKQNLDNRISATLVGKRRYLFLPQIVTQQNHRPS